VLALPPLAQPKRLLVAVLFGVVMAPLAMGGVLRQGLLDASDGASRLGLALVGAMPAGQATGAVFTRLAGGDVALAVLVSALSSPLSARLLPRVWPAVLGAPLPRLSQPLGDDFTTQMDTLILTTTVIPALLGALISMAAGLATQGRKGGKGGKGGEPSPMAASLSQAGAVVASLCVLTAVTLTTAANATRFTGKGGLQAGGVALYALLLTFYLLAYSVPYMLAKVRRARAVSLGAATCRTRRTRRPSALPLSPRRGNRPPRVAAAAARAAGVRLQRDGRAHAGYSVGRAQRGGRRGAGGAARGGGARRGAARADGHPGPKPGGRDGGHRLAAAAVRLQRRRRRRQQQ